MEGQRSTGTVLGLAPEHRIGGILASAARVHQSLCTRGLASSPGARTSEMRSKRSARFRPGCWIMIAARSGYGAGCIR
jgi:hypothetical protein